MPHLIVSYLRHALPGVQELIKNHPDLKNAENTEIAYDVNFCLTEKSGSRPSESVKPTLIISVFRASDLLDPNKFASLEGEETRRMKFQHVLNRAGPNRRLVHVTVFRGGVICNSMVMLLPASDFYIERGFAIGDPLSEPGVSIFNRTRALDKKGNELKTMWDSVNAVMWKGYKWQMEKQKGRGGDTKSMYRRFEEVADDIYKRTNYGMLPDDSYNEMCDYMNTPRPELTRHCSDL